MWSNRVTKRQLVVLISTVAVEAEEEQEGETEPRLPQSLSVDGGDHSSPTVEQLSPENASWHPSLKLKNSPNSLPRSLELGSSRGLL